jgi:hypothetical protein
MPAYKRRDSVEVNRVAVMSMALHGDYIFVQKLYRVVRATMRRLGLGPFDSPPTELTVALSASEYCGTHPSIFDIEDWLNSLHQGSEDDSDFDSDTDDNSVDEFEFLSRLFLTLDQRVAPSYKTSLVDAE